MAKEKPLVTEETLDGPPGEAEQIAPVQYADDSVELPEDPDDDKDVVLDTSTGKVSVEPKTAAVDVGKSEVHVSAAEKPEPNRKHIGAAARILAEQKGVTVAAAAENIRREPSLLDEVIEQLQQLRSDCEAANEAAEARKAEAKKATDSKPPADSN